MLAKHALYQLSYGPRIRCKTGWLAEPKLAAASPACALAGSGEAAISRCASEGW
jgi:hypothetical protein